MTRSGSYHHGDLRRALLDAAAEAMAESGVAELSLRDLARRAGVSHAAPAHHFGDKAGLLTALATEGYQLLGEALREGDDGLLEAGVAYVRFAVRHPAHFEVMFRPDLHRADDQDLAAARARTRELLRGGVAQHTGRDPDVDSLAAWSIVHGFATLWLSGALPPRLGTDPEAAARTVIRRLFS
ncbi:TetR/AcrR family transcriptional regulator [Micromonospora sp. NPDC050686]|uniref:TetR/AcrR family transcriptional regulator n=1 Tax=Micromonospora sp. NPDC050686 TaxID=3154631 RepID=UPI0034050376